jgi:carbohydrate-binding DOMON domain-containing protein
MLGSLVAFAGEGVWFKDPVGDDNGPGGYVYPTDSAYTKGAFDLTEFRVTTKGDRVIFDVNVKAPLADPWGLRSGFSVQMVFIFIQTDKPDGPRFTEGVPGLNVAFEPEAAWNKLVILSPQPAARVEGEIELRVEPEMQRAIIVPDRAKGKDHTISAGVDLASLGGGDPAKWGYQVVMQSNEGYPEDNDLLTRKVYAVEQEHRFGGGHNDDCDPHVLDVLAGNASGAAEEVALQHEMLKYACNPDGSAKRRATLKMIRKP